MMAYSMKIGFVDIIIFIIKKKNQMTNLGRCFRSDRVLNNRG